ncbi:MAG TPA: acetoacetate decarboxylase family protein [Acidobacteriota bacterium]|jgi:acetoacetate decarboxylase|nr:acetoacetate decarboxylase family protein [Acidobacteriota bacterium]HNR39444.1 acetoacetate decarboxylase family protein [Acidobacteriota bacterium]HNU00042.1 acetoacetate decarboxylase family protein [Acidobacteriota bacterium]HPB71120.1 acetoacetate decarboxylase family protein [Syntrophales bacterium]
MKNGSYFIPREQLHAFMNPGAMNNEEGLYIFWETDPAVARRVLPPMLELLDPAHPIAMVYVVNIREPTFAPWYMEGGLSLLCRYGETVGAYFLNLQLSGPGAHMGLCSGRETSGLPKKMCERIVVERKGDWARAFIERHGRRIFSTEVELGDYNDPLLGIMRQDYKPGYQERGACLLFQYECGPAPAGHMIIPQARLLHYDSVIDYTTWEPARIQSIQMEHSLDDPWAELLVVKLLGAGYSINSNWVAGLSTLAQYDGAEADSLFSYLFSGRWDRSTLVTGRHQIYGQF